MAFPPNYNQERNNRARAKAQKALDKQNEREDKSARRKQLRAAEDHAPAPEQAETEKR
jgi:hypothetical protein